MFIEVKHRRNNSNPEIFAEIAQFNKVRIDQKKIDLQRKDLVLALENYCLFQKYSLFRWPAWLYNSSVAETPDFRPLSPPFLINNTIREGISFTNLFSNSELFVDPSGMISPSYDAWSAEIWIRDGDRLFRPSENIRSVDIRKDPSGGTVTVSWAEGHFEFTMTIIGARMDIDEAVIQIRSSCKTKPGNAALIISFRPYNNTRLGTISAISYKKDGAVSINGKTRVVLLDKPGMVLTGTGKDGDIDVFEGVQSFTAVCDTGMAALSCCYPLKKGENEISLRVSLDSVKEIKTAKIDFVEMKKGFQEFSRLRAGNGSRLELNDTGFKNWFYGNKQSLLNMTARGLSSLPAEYDHFNYRSFFYLVLGCARMGYFEEGVQLITLALEGAAGWAEKNLPFADAVDVSYTLAGFTDFYFHTRDMDLLQKHHAALKKSALALAGFCSSLKKISDLDCNSLDYNFTGEGHAHDLALFSTALARFAYLSRCMGIFGDETIFEKEADRIGGIFRSSAVQGRGMGPRDDFFCYNASSVFPFGMKTVSGRTGEDLCDSILSCVGEAPVIVKSLGVDLMATLLSLNCMTYMKKKQVWDILDRVFKLGGNRLSLPDFANPLTKHGCWGGGASLPVSSMLFCTMRNLLFIDTQDRLELFPVPKEDWFKPGSEIRIQDMPSRFGRLTIRAATTVNEIQVQFEQLPKYVPPDIMINLPFNASVIKEDDYVLKKEFGSSFLINGWPEIIRFVKI